MGSVICFYIKIPHLGLIHKSVPDGQGGQLDQSPGALPPPQSAALLAKFPRIILWKKTAAAGT